MPEAAQGGESALVSALPGRARRVIGDEGVEQPHGAGAALHMDPRAVPVAVAGDGEVREEGLARAGHEDAAAPAAGLVADDGRVADQAVPGAVEPAAVASGPVVGRQVGVASAGARAEQREGSAVPPGAVQPHGVRLDRPGEPAGVQAAAILGGGVPLDQVAGQAPGAVGVDPATAA